MFFDEPALSVREEEQYYIYAYKKIIIRLERFPIHINEEWDIVLVKPTKGFVYSVILPFCCVFLNALIDVHLGSGCLNNGWSKKAFLTP